MARDAKTASELMRGLESNPEWIRRLGERERDRLQQDAQLNADEAELVRKIRSLGYDIESVYDFVNNAGILYSCAGLSARTSAHILCSSIIFAVRIIPESEKGLFARSQCETVGS